MLENFQSPRRESSKIEFLLTAGSRQRRRRSQASQEEATQVITKAEAAAGVANSINEFGQSFLRAMKKTSPMIRLIDDIGKKHNFCKNKQKYFDKIGEKESLKVFTYLHNQDSQFNLILEKIHSNTLLIFFSVVL